MQCRCRPLQTAARRHMLSCMHKQKGTQHCRCSTCVQRLGPLHRHKLAAAPLHTTERWPLQHILLLRILPCCPHLLTAEWHRGSAAGGLRSSRSSIAMLLCIGTCRMLSLLGLLLLLLLLLLLPSCASAVMPCRCLCGCCRGCWRWGQAWWQELLLWQQVVLGDAARHPVGRHKCHTLGQPHTGALAHSHLPGWPAIARRRAGIND